MNPSRRLALFADQVGALALEADKIEAVLECCEVFSLPQLPRSFAGVCMFREQPVPVLAPLLFPGGRPLKRAYLALCMTEMGLIAVPVAQAGQIVENHQGVIEEAEDSDRPDGAGCFVYRNVRYPLLDFERLLEQLQS